MLWTRCWKLECRGQTLESRNRKLESGSQNALFCHGVLDQLLAEIDAEAVDRCYFLLADEMEVRILDVHGHSSPTITSTVPDFPCAAQAVSPLSRTRISARTSMPAVKHRGQALQKASTLPPQRCRVRSRNAIPKALRDAMESTPSAPPPTLRGRKTMSGPRTLKAGFMGVGWRMGGWKLL